MNQHVLWSQWHGQGLEHLRLNINSGSIVADSLLIVGDEAIPYRVSYRILCDPDWTVRELKVELPGEEKPAIDLRSDGNGHWHTRQGETLAFLEGCIDVDISVTPFTNTLPIRRLRLEPGQSAEIRVVYVTLPSLELKAVRQHYTRLEPEAGAARYRYQDESIPGGFSAVIRVDDNGLVVDYPDLFKRLLLHQE